MSDFSNMDLLPPILFTRALTGVGEDYGDSWRARFGNNRRRLTWINRFFIGNLNLEIRAPSKVKSSVLRWRKACKHLQFLIRNQYSDKQIIILIDCDVIEKDVTRIVRMYLSK